MRYLTKVPMPSSFSRKLQYGFGVAFGLDSWQRWSLLEEKAEPEKEPEPSPLKSILSMTYVQFLCGVVPEPLKYLSLDMYSTSLQRRFDP